MSDLKLLLIASCLLILSCSQESTPELPMETSSKVTSPPEAEQLSEGAETVTISLEEFSQELAQSVEETEQKYDRKWLEFKAYVVGFLINPKPTNIKEFEVLLDIRAEPFEPRRLLYLKPFRAVCHLQHGQKPWEKVSIGDEVTLRGRMGNCSEKEKDFVEVELIDAKGTPTPSLSAAELVSEYLADPKAFKETYTESNRQVVVTGAVIANADGIPGTLLKGPDQEGAFALYLDPMWEAQFKEIEAGDEITVLGQTIHDDELNPDEGLYPMKLWSSYVLDAAE